MDRFLTKKSVENHIDVESSSSSSLTKANGPCGDLKSNIKSKVKRKFRPEWSSKYTWLENRNGNSYCIACEKKLYNHINNLKTHEAKPLHRKNIEMKKQQRKIESCIDEEHTKIKKQVHMAELNLVMYCITHNLPFLIMDSLPNLLMECCPDSKIAKLLQCRRTKATQLSEVLGNKAKDKIVSNLKTGKFSLNIDETTDVATKKSLVLVVRYVDNLSKMIHDRFLGLIELSKFDANHIYEAIKQFFSKYEIPLKNLVGLATDGASVMAGEINGVQSKLSKHVDLFYMKCTCHSLHLCSANACKKIPNEVEKLCRNIYKFFAHSAKRINDFQEFQNYSSVAPHKILGV